MKLSPYVLLFSSFTFIILFSCYCFKNIHAQTNTQDLPYQPPSFGIKISYPPDWKANSDESDPKAEKTTIVTFSPKINSNYTDGAVKVWVDNNPPTYNSELYLQKELDTNKKNIANYTFLSLNVDYTLSGHPAFSYNYLTKVNGKDVQYLVVGIIINGKAYEVTYLALTEKFPVNLFNANRIINSFQVLPSSLSLLGLGGGDGGSNGSSGTTTTSNSNPPAINNVNIVNQLNDIKKNQSGVGDNASSSSGLVSSVNSNGGGNINNTNTNTTPPPTCSQQIWGQDHH